MAYGSYPHYLRKRFATLATISESGADSAVRRACPACGTSLTPPAHDDAPGVTLRAALPQPIAAALRLTHLLSARERTVFELLGAGQDNRTIARELEVSERTVKRHVTVILTKLHLESRLQAGLAALLSSSSVLARTR